MAGRTDYVDLRLFQQAQTYLRDVRQNGHASIDGLEAWERFYAACDGMIRRFAGAFGVRPADMDDCCQDVWSQLLKLLMHFDYDPSRGEFRTWLYKIVRSATVDFLRRRDALREQQQTLRREARPGDAVDTEASPSAQLEDAEARAAAQTMLTEARHHLSPENYRLICLRWFEGRSVRQAADELGMTPEQIWAHEHRVRKTLRRVFTSHAESRMARYEALAQSSAVPAAGAAEPAQ